MWKTCDSCTRGDYFVDVNATTAKPNSNIFVKEYIVGKSEA